MEAFFKRKPVKRKERAPSLPSAPHDPLSFLTWNANSLMRRVTDPQHAAKTVPAMAALFNRYDLVCLQETMVKPKDTAQIESKLRVAGCPHHFFWSAHPTKTRSTFNVASSHSARSPLRDEEGVPETRKRGNKL